MSSLYCVKFCHANINACNKSALGLYAMRACFTSGYIFILHVCNWCREWAGPTRQALDKRQHMLQPALSSHCVVKVVLADAGGIQVN